MPSERVSASDGIALEQGADMKKPKILFVCLGNICRSPMAEYILRRRAAEVGIPLETDSAGTSGWHDGEDMHRETAKILKKHGIDASGFISRKIRQSDAAVFDCIIAMDGKNLSELEKTFGRQPEKIFKLTDLIPESGYDHVPDPWYTGNFEETYRLVDAGCRALLEKISK